MALYIGGITPHLLFPSSDQSLATYLDSTGSPKDSNKATTLVVNSSRIGAERFGIANSQGINLTLDWALECEPNNFNGGLTEVPVFRIQSLTSSASIYILIEKLSKNGSTTHIYDGYFYRPGQAELLYINGSQQNSGVLLESIQRVGLVMDQGGMNKLSVYHAGILDGRVQPIGEPLVSTVIEAPKCSDNDPYAGFMI
jgi:hypothetical protein